MDGLLIDGLYLNVRCMKFSGIQRIEYKHARFYPLGDKTSLFHKIGTKHQHLRFLGDPCVFLGDGAYRVIKRRGHWLLIVLPGFPRPLPAAAWVCLLDG